MAIRHGHFLGTEDGMVLEHGEAVQATVHRESRCFQASDLGGQQFGLMLRFKIGTLYIGVQIYSVKFKSALS